MKRHLIPLGIAVALAAAALGSATAGAKTLGTLINLKHTSAGNILVNSHGYTLYGFSLDKKNKDACTRISGCIMAWPLVTTRANTKLRAGRGVNAHLLGTIKVGRSLQVTYSGHPLYTYIGDAGPADTEWINFLNFQGTWPALNAKGQLVDQHGHKV